MAGLWRNNPKTREGKYPIVLRRDGSVVKDRYFVLLLKDPAAAAALRAYAVAAEHCGMDPEYVAQVREMAAQAEAEAIHADKPSEPDGPPERIDDPVTLAWAREHSCPGS